VPRCLRTLHRGSRARSAPEVPTSSTGKRRPVPLGQPWCWQVRLHGGAPRPRRPDPERRARCPRPTKRSWAAAAAAGKPADKVSGVYSQHGPLPRCTPMPALHFAATLAARLPAPARPPHAATTPGSPVRSCGGLRTFIPYRCCSPLAALSGRSRPVYPGTRCPPPLPTTEANQRTAGRRGSRHAAVAATNPSWGVRRPPRLEPWRRGGVDVG
jgi:hypothetical protein